MIDDPAKAIRRAVLVAKGLSRTIGPMPGKGGGGVEGFSGGGTPGEDDPGIQKTLGIARQLTPQGLYSHGAEVAAALPQAKGTPQQMQAMLIARGVKPEEMKWSGTQNTFSGQHSVTKDQLAQQFQQGMPDIHETVLSIKQESRLGTPTINCREQTHLIQKK